MKEFDINLAFQILVIIPRFYPENDIELTIEREFNGTTYTRTFTNLEYVISNGYLSIVLDDSEFLDMLDNNSTFRILIKDSKMVVYRGKAIATNQEPQDYQLTKGVYIYG